MAEHFAFFEWLLNGSGNILNNWLFYNVQELKQYSSLRDTVQKLSASCSGNFDPEVMSIDYRLSKHGNNLFEGSHSYLKFSLDGTPFVLDIEPFLFVPDQIAPRFMWAVIPWAVINDNPDVFYMYTGGDYDRRDEITAHPVRSDVRSYYARMEESGLPFTSNDPLIAKAASDCYHFAFRADHIPKDLAGAYKSFGRGIEGMPDDELDPELMRLSGCSIAPGKMTSNQIYHDIWAKARLGPANTDNIRILLLCREWGRRYYRPEQRFSGCLPMESFVKEKLMTQDRFVNRFGASADKKMAIEAAGMTDDLLIDKFSSITGYRYDLRSHTCEEIMIDIARPAYKRLGELFRAGQSGQASESGFKAYREYVEKMDIILEEWFYRNAWQSSARFADRKREVEFALCAQDWLFDRGLGEYFGLLEIGMVFTPSDPCFKERSVELLSLFHEAGLGSGDLFANIGCGASDDASVIAAVMGAEVIASDINTGDQRPADYIPEIWQALVDGGILTKSGKPTAHFWGLWREYDRVPMLMRKDFDFGIDQLPINRDSTDLAYRISHDYHTGLNRAKQKACERLEKDMLPSDKEYISRALSRIYWVGGQKGNVFNIGFKRPLKAALMEGLIDVGAGGSGGCFGGAPQRLFSDESINGMLSRTFDGLENGGSLFVGVFQPDRMVKEYQSILGRFALSRPDVSYDGNYKIVPRSSESLVWGGSRDGQMFVLKKENK
jgi:hypothetical protein